MTRAERAKYYKAREIARAQGQTVFIDPASGRAEALTNRQEDIARAQQITQQSNIASQQAFEQKRLKAIAEGGRRSERSQQIIAGIEAEKRAKEEARKRTPQLGGVYRVGTGEARRIEAGKPTEVIEKPRARTYTGGIYQQLAQPTESRVYVTKTAERPKTIVEQTGTPKFQAKFRTATYFTQPTYTYDISGVKTGEGETGEQALRGTAQFTKKAVSAFEEERSRVPSVIKKLESPFQYLQAQQTRAVNIIRGKKGELPVKEQAFNLFTGAYTKARETISQADINIRTLLSQERQRVRESRAKFFGTQVSPAEQVPSGVQPRVREKLFGIKGVRPLQFSQTPISETIQTGKASFQFAREQAKVAVRRGKEAVEGLAEFPVSIVRGGLKTGKILVETDPAIQGLYGRKIEQGQFIPRVVESVVTDEDVRSFAIATGVVATAGAGLYFAPTVTPLVLEAGSYGIAGKGLLDLARKPSYRQLGRTSFDVLFGVESATKAGSTFRNLYTSVGSTEIKGYTGKVGGKGLREVKIRSPKVVSGEESFPSAKSQAEAERRFRTNILVKGRVVKPYERFDIVDVTGGELPSGTVVSAKPSVSVRGKKIGSLKELAVVRKSVKGSKTEDVLVSYHAASVKAGEGITEVKAQTRRTPSEVTGIYVAPEISEKFLRIGGGSAYSPSLSLFPTLEGLKQSPHALAIEYKRFVSLPKSIVREKLSGSGVKARKLAEDFYRRNLGKGFIFATPKYQGGRNIAEAEGIVGVGEFFKNIIGQRAGKGVKGGIAKFKGYARYIKVGGVPVPIYNERLLRFAELGKEEKAIQLALRKGDLTEVERVNLQKQLATQQRSAVKLLSDERYSVESYLRSAQKKSVPYSYGLQTPARIVTPRSYVRPISKVSSALGSSVISRVSSKSAVSSLVKPSSKAVSQSKSVARSYANALSSYVSPAKSSQATSTSYSEAVSKITASSVVKPVSKSYVFIARPPTTPPPVRFTRFKPQRQRKELFKFQKFKVTRVFKPSLVGITRGEVQKRVPTAVSGIEARGVSAKTAKYLETVFGKV